MDANLSAASSFMASHARTLHRRRFDLLVEGGDPAPVLAAVDAYRNADGGYGWGLEPDLRAPESQPACALHALEAFADAAPATSPHAAPSAPPPPATSPHAAQLCDWLESVSLADGGLPFALPVGDPAACAPF